MILYCYLHKFFPCFFHIILVMEESMFEVWALIIFFPRETSNHCAIISSEVWALIIFLPRETSNHCAIISFDPLFWLVYSRLIQQCSFVFSIIRPSERCWLEKHVWYFRTGKKHETTFPNSLAENMTSFMFLKWKYFEMQVFSDHSGTAKSNQH